MDTKDPATPPQEDPLERIGEALGHAFRDRALLEEAFAHPSWACEHPGAPSNQRLEFLGDAVVDLCLARLLFERFPDADEGGLTRLRSELASGRALGRKAAALFRRLFAEDVAALSAVPAGGESPKSALQIRTVRRFGAEPVYEVLLQDGTPNDPRFVVRVSAAGLSAEGEGRSKRAAETAAASALLAKLGEDPAGRESKE